MQQSRRAGCGGGGCRRCTRGCRGRRGARAGGRGGVGQKAFRSCCAGAACRTEVALFLAPGPPFNGGVASGHRDNAPLRRCARRGGESDIRRCLQYCIRPAGADRSHATTQTGAMRWRRAAPHRDPRTSAEMCQSSSCRKSTVVDQPSEGGHGPHIHACITNTRF